MLKTLVKYTILPVSLSISRILQLFGLLGDFIDNRIVKKLVGFAK